MSHSELEYHFWAYHVPLKDLMKHYKAYLYVEREVKDTKKKTKTSWSIPATPSQIYEYQGDKLVLSTKFKVGKFSFLRLMLHPFFSRNKHVEDTLNPPSEGSDSLELLSSNAFVKPFSYPKGKKFEMIWGENFWLWYHRDTSFLHNGKYGDLSEMFIFQMGTKKMKMKDVKKEAIELYAEKHKEDKDLEEKCEDFSRVLNQIRICLPDSRTGIAKSLNKS